MGFMFAAFDAGMSVIKKLTSIEPKTAMHRSNGLIFAVSVIVEILESSGSAPVIKSIKDKTPSKFMQKITPRIAPKSDPTIPI